MLRLVILRAKLSGAVYIVIGHGGRAACVCVCVCVFVGLLPR